MKKRKGAVCLAVKAVSFAFFIIVLVLGLSAFFGHFFRQSNVPASLEVREDLRPAVILDPGHGGADPGAISVIGTEEKQINLALAKSLGAFLEAAGIRVIYTRENDEMLTSSKTDSRKMGDLMGRVDLAAAYPDATFVSIHMNTLPIEKYNGLQVFYSENHDANKVLALRIQNDVRDLLQPENKREVKDHKGSIYVLDRIQTPAVLVECGFLSNHDEATLLADEAYRNKLAYVLSRSLVSFLLQKQNLE